MGIARASMGLGPDRSRTTPAKGAPRRRVFLVDDHPVIRYGLSMLINAESDLAVCGEADAAYEALRAIKETKPDAVILDISLQDADGMELLKELQAWAPQLPVLVFSIHDESLYAERALRAGSRGYVMKDQRPAILLAAIHKVLAGGIYLSEAMGSRLLQRMVGDRHPEHGGLPMDRLTDRELEVFRMIGGGQTVKEIASKLSLSVKTVESHREHIKDKLNLATSAELLRFAVRNGGGDGEQEVCCPAGKCGAGEACRCIPMVH